MPTLSSMTRRIDDAFTHTWYEIRPQAIDNILDARVVTAALRMKGCFQTQVGGEFMTEPVRYGKKTATNVQKGDTLSHGEDEIETMAYWGWKYSSSHIQRSLQDDQKNNGPSKIKSLVQTKIDAAKDAIDDMIESNIMRVVDTGGGTDLRADRDPDSIFNILPGGAYYNQAPGTYIYGNIDTGTGNTWWQGKYKTATDPIEVNLVEDMTNLWNTCGKNEKYPDLLITNQTVFEAYESFGVHMSQMTQANGLLNLGFQTLKFKGADIVWTDKVTTNDVLMLHTPSIKLKYDPNMWFDMTEWKTIPLQMERIAHIICAMNLICNQLRRQGRLGSYT